MTLHAFYTQEESTLPPTQSKMRVEALRAKHNMYKDLIKQAQQSPATTDFYLRQLKKQKLIIKEELEGIRSLAERRKAS